MSKKIDIPKDVKKPEATKAKPEVKKTEAAKAEPKKDAKTITPTKVSVKAEEAKKEEPKVSQEELKIVEVPDACDAVIDGFKTKGKVGFYDGESDDCKACGEEFPAAMAACKQNTETEVKMAATKKTPKKKGGGASKGGEKTPLGGLASSGAGRNELLLLSKEGVTMEEMQKNRGAVSSHLAALKKKGFFIEHKDGKYFGSVTSFEKKAEVKKETPKAEVKKEAPKADVKKKK